jgi:NAD(P)-dependent dehydrogenase (short-subunit alcohol dehydrogenase family)
MPVTLVTGTSTGIGLATALHFARHGHQVVATMRNLAKAGPLEAAARDGKLPLVVRELDVTRPESIDRAVAETVAQQGPIDVLVNNAGIGGATPLELTPEDEHRAMFEANYWGPIRMIRAVLPSMRERRTRSRAASRRRTRSRTRPPSSRWARRARRSPTRSPPSGCGWRSSSRG